MIGWRPYLLSIVGVAALVVAGVDVGVTLHHQLVGVPWSFAGAVHGIADNVARVLTHMSVLDWVIVGCALELSWWAWARAIASARLGPIEIAHIATDDASLNPVAAKAQLQKEFGRRGFVPAGGVPGGSPTVASIAAAIRDAPLPQASWLADLIGLVPTPPTSTGFKLSATLSRGDDSKEPYALSYQLGGTGPQRTVTFGTVTGPTITEAIEAASKKIYRKITEAAPNVYPRWSRWATSEALTEYRRGIEVERAPQPGREQRHRDGVAKRYEDACKLYQAASRLDPENMLARLRIGNCIERIATNQIAAAARAERQMDALLEYMTIRVQHPEIFEAGFRASVLLSGLAASAGEIKLNPEKVDSLRGLLDRAWRDHDGLGWVDRLMIGRRKSREVSLTIELERAARRESRLARMRLRPLWTLVNYGRVRHRFEPTGRTRRQLRKALRISRMAIRARRASGPGPTSSELGQLCWQAWMSARYMCGRSHVAGWQAHYNAACFYALLPVAATQYGRGPRKRALRHLREAIAQAGGAIPADYLRDEDPDLDALREHDNQRFQSVVRPLFADELTVHYRRQEPIGWKLHVWGEGAEGTEWGKLLGPESACAAEAKYRVRLRDVTKPVEFLAQNGDGRDQPGWRLVPASLDSSQIWVFAGDAIVYSCEPPAHGVRAARSRGASPSYPP